MNYVATCNAGEAVFWIALGIFIFARYGRRALPSRQAARYLAGFLFAFALSDVIEIFTGAW